MSDDDFAATTRAIIREMLDRLQQGAPVTEDLLARIPKGARVELPVTVTGRDGTRRQGTILLKQSAVTFHWAGERPN